MDQTRTNGAGWFESVCLVFLPALSMERPWKWLAVVSATCGPSECVCSKTKLVGRDEDSSLPPSPSFSGTEQAQTDVDLAFGGGEFEDPLDRVRVWVWGSVIFTGYSEGSSFHQRPRSSTISARRSRAEQPQQQQQQQEEQWREYRLRERCCRVSMVQRTRSSSLTTRNAVQ